MALILVFAPVAYYYNRNKSQTTNYPFTSTTTGIPDFSHIYIIVEENHNNFSILGNPEASFINSLANKYAVATNYNAVTRPSLPNYLHLTSATSRGTKGNCNPPGPNCIVKSSNIADEIESSHRTWKTYLESMPSPCNTSAYNEKSLYDIEHNPFVYYENILNNEERCKSHVVPLSELESDLASVETTPSYLFIVPNRCNDMHDCDIKTGDIWLSSTVTKLLDSPSYTQQNSLLVIVWDEGGKEDNANNRVPLILIGPSVKQSYKSSTYYTHHSLLHTIEASWGLNSFNESDKNAPTLLEFFNP